MNETPRFSHHAMAIELRLLITIAFVLLALWMLLSDVGHLLSIPKAKLDISAKRQVHSSVPIRPTSAKRHSAY